MTGKGISIIVPLYNEAENVGPVLRELAATLSEAEIVAVNDGSTDTTLAELAKFGSRIRIISFPSNRGQGTAIYEGLVAATHDTCVIMDGDGQYDPRDIPKLVDKLAFADLVCGWRRVRNDRLSARLASKYANAVRRMVLRDDIRDTGGLKVLRKNIAVKLLYSFEGIHRYISSIFVAAGYRVAEIPISHRPRMNGQSKYTHAGRALRGIHDLFRIRCHLAHLHTRQQ